MLINIQFLRFVAALLVVLYHAAAHVRAAGHEPGLLFGFGQSAGFAGVDVFFVISGFIMLWTTTEDSGGHDAWRFLRRRVARIYSGYWPFFALAVALFWWLGGPRLADAALLRSFLLWPTALGELLIPVSWTLIFEMGFYLLFAVVVGFTGPRRVLVIGALAIAAVGWTAYAQFIRRAYDPGVLEVMSVYEQYLAFPYLLEFLAGALLAAWCRARPGGLAWTPLLAGAALFVAGGWVNDTGFGGRLIQGYFVTWRVLLFGTGATLIVLGLVRLEHRGVRILPRFSLQAGGASYALYLGHTLALAATNRLGFDAWAGTLPGWLAQGAYLGLVAAIVAYSIAHYRGMERPLHRLFRRALSVRPPQPIRQQTA